MKSIIFILFYSFMSLMAQDNLLWKINVKAQVSGNYTIRENNKLIQGKYNFRIYINNFLCADTPENIKLSDIITLPQNTIVLEKSWIETTKLSDGNLITTNHTELFEPEFILSSFTKAPAGIRYYYEIADNSKKKKPKLLFPSSFRKYTKNIKKPKPTIIISTSASRFFNESKKWHYIKKRMKFSHNQTVLLKLKGESTLTNMR